MKTPASVLGLLVVCCLLSSEVSAAQGKPFQDLQRQIDALKAQVEQLSKASKSRCPPDSVRAGTVCMDKYEMSIWETTSPRLIRKIRNGTVTLAELLAGGAIQRGTAPFGGVGDYAPGCPDSAAGCMDFYAVSIKGVRPSGHANWFQASAAARNSGKRLPTNAEWQAAALGTPDGSLGICVVGGEADTIETGSRPGCVSDVGAFDMVGNIVEFVADWAPRSTTCASWGLFSNNEQCLAGAAVEGPPGAILRGGGTQQGGFAGPFYINGAVEPIAQGAFIGYRAVR
jgi:hypothetical protein